MVIIGITGNIASGKTTVAGFLASRGVRIIDADCIAHRLIRPKTSLWKEIVQSFGPDILNKNQVINRRKLARAAFADTKNWQLLCKLMHPKLIKIIKQEVKQARRQGTYLVAIDAALLLESGLEALVDYIIVVRADLSQQLTRAKEKLGIGVQEFKNRLRFQLPFREKIKKAHFIIDNRRTLEFTERQVEKLWKKITQRQNRLKK